MAKIGRGVRVLVWFDVRYGGELFLKGFGRNF